MKLTRIAFLSLLMAVFCFGASAQTVDEIVNKHIEAIGGAANWMKVKSIKQSGSMQVQGADVDIALTVVAGKGSRQDVTIAGMGISGYQIITPTEGWNFAPYNGMMAPEAMTADELAKAQGELDPQGPLVDYKAKGHTVSYLGKEDVEGVECFKLKIDMKSGKTQTWFIDPSTYYVIQVISKEDVNGQETDVTTGLGNYEKLPEGIVVPKSITLPFGELVIGSVEVNQAVDESVFKKPA